MFDGVEMHVLDVVGQIGVIADLVFPETALPDAFFAFGDFAGAALGVGGQSA